MKRGEMLKKIRDLFPELTMEQLADKLGVSDRTCRSWISKSKKVVEKCFTGSISRLDGMGFDEALCDW